MLSVQIDSAAVVHISAMLEAVQVLRVDCKQTLTHPVYKNSGKTLIFQLLFFYFCSIIVHTQLSNSFPYCTEDTFVKFGTKYHIFGVCKLPEASSPVCNSILYVYRSVDFPCKYPILFQCSILHIKGETQTPGCIGSGLHQPSLDR